MIPSRRHRRCGTAGLTVIELVIATSLVAMAGMAVTPMIGKVSSLRNLTTLADAERDVAKVADLFVNDLREAAPGSFDWNTIPKIPPATAGTNINAITFLTYHYDNSDPATPSSTTIRYNFQAGPTGKPGTLVRTATTGSVVSQKTILKNVVPPTTVFPLVYHDTSTYRVLAITLRYDPPDQPPVRLVRRTAIKG